MTEIEKAIADERERCALLNEQLAAIHEAGAVRTRNEGSYQVRALFPWRLVTRVKPGWERLAQCQDGAAGSLRTIARCIRAGYDPRKPPETKVIQPPANEAERRDATLRTYGLERPTDYWKGI